VSLRSRLLLAIAAVALVALLVADVATYSSLKSFLYDRVDQTLLSEAQQLGGQGPVGGGQGDAQPSPEGATGQAAAGPPPAFLRGAPNGFVERRLADGQAEIGPYPAYQDGKSFYAQVPAEITGFQAVSVPGGGPDQEVAYLTVPSTVAGGPQFRVVAVRQPDGDVLLVGSLLTDTVQTLQRLLLIELAVTAAALVAALAVGLWLVRVGLRPLRDVEETADSIAAGHVDRRVPGENETTEVGRLARALNAMLTQIEQAFAQRDATEAELRRSEAMLRQFVADASHELRTPLAAVSAYAELFERGARERPEDLARVMAGIREEAGRMRRLVEDLLLLARLDEGHAVEYRPVELVTLAGDAARTAAAVGPDWPVVVEADRPVEVVGDELRLRQVVDNLLANVRAHTPAGTTTTVRLAADGGEAVVVVADDGPGFGPDHGAHVFERFYRADPSRSRVHGGAGLGLAIVAAIVAAHHGQVWATDAPEGGAMIVIRLPRAGSAGGDGQPATARSDSAPLPAGPASDGDPIAHRSPGSDLVGPRGAGG
jgi:two-component system OmpR family sensor kinase